MVEVLDKEKEFKYGLVLKEIIILEELPKEEKLEESKVIEQEKPRKKVLSKILYKAKYNANYFKEIKAIEEIKNRINVRNRVIY